jgi:pyrroloquinoline quinone biosynthesis protein B
MTKAYLLILALIMPLCQPATKMVPTGPAVVVLGTVQDGGSPHIGCTKACCRDLFDHPDAERKIVSLGLTDPENRKKFLVEATPDITFQVNNLAALSGFEGPVVPDGIVVTHAHTGHYTGLMYLGREAMNAKMVPVYALPRMKAFLEGNGPWNQLVTLGNIGIRQMEIGNPVELTGNLQVTPFTVPHRDEFSETAGLLIAGPSKKMLFIPDIDKWDKWDTDIVKALAGVDYALIDGTFFDAAELPGRNMSEIPHPFIRESMERFRNLPAAEKDKIWFIHLNHTNPALVPGSKQSAEIMQNGFHVARIKTRFNL